MSFNCATFIVYFIYMFFIAMAVHSWLTQIWGLFIFPSECCISCNRPLSCSVPLQGMEHVQVLWQL